MESEGQRTPAQAPTPTAVLTALLCKRAKLHEELRGIEKQVYDMETNYLQDPSQCGNVLKGFDGFLTNKNTTLLKRSRKFQPEDRLFSLSSITSLAFAPERSGWSILCRDWFCCLALRDSISVNESEEQAAAREVGGIYASGQGKPKRGRGGFRDAKRIRQSEQDLDYEEEADMM